MNTGYAIAIDGPSGAGKSTAAKNVARTMGLVYVDTGAMYRAIALFAIQNGMDPKNRVAVERLLTKINIEIVPDKKGQRLILNETDVTDLLRAQDIAEGASLVAQYEAVREKLTTLQREIASKGHVVMDGRDIGSVVLPWAQVKIYLDADLKTRIARRADELRAKGLPIDLKAIRSEIEIRDDRDTNRAFGPLTRAADAVYLDTTGLDEKEVNDKIIAIIKSKKP